MELATCLSISSLHEVTLHYITLLSVTYHKMYWFY